MPKGSNQKLKLYRLAQIMLEKTDDDHYITMPEIMAELEKYEITAERKSIYADFKALDDLGIEIEGEQRGKQFFYHCIGRQFEIAELKLLVDAIQASKFITARKSNELIKKLETFCSTYEAKQLQRQVYVQDRIKSMNESVYYSVDAIHNAIAENKQIKFQYFNWNENKEMVLRRDGQFYEISPWSLLWDDENYYLIGFDEEADMIKHYRVDKMLKISTVDVARSGKDKFKDFNGARYAKKNFSMFSGEEESVTVKLNKSMCGVFVDRFGKDINFVSVDDKYCTVRLQVSLSPHFCGWIFALGADVEVVGPENVRKRFCEEAKRIYNIYK